MKSTTFVTNGYFFLNAGHFNNPKKVSGIIYGTIKDDNNLLEVPINQNERKLHAR